MKDKLDRCLAALIDLNEQSKPPSSIPLPAEIDFAMDSLRTAIAEMEKAEPTGFTSTDLIQAAEKFAANYDDDDRQDIKTDVLNAFYSGTRVNAESTERCLFYERTNAEQAKLLNAVIAERDAYKADAEKWRAYEQRRDNFDEESA